MAFTWANVQQLPPQISCACHFLYSQDPVKARKVTLLPWLCYLEGPSGSRDAGHFCLPAFHFLLSLWLIWLVWSWFPDSRVTAYAESSVYPISPFQLFLSHENDIFKRWSFLFPAYCRVKLWAWHLERILYVISLISYGKQRPVRSAPAPSPDKPGFLSPSHPSSPTGIPQLFWNPVGYWVMHISFSVSSSVSTNLYIFYLCHLKKEYLTALGSNLVSNTFLGARQSAESYLAGLLRELNWKLTVKLHLFFFYFSVRFLLPISLPCGHLVYTLLKA